MITLSAKREQVVLLFFGLWLVVLSVILCLLFLLVSLVGYDLRLWLFLDIFYTVSLKHGIGAARTNGLSLQLPAVIPLEAQKQIQSRNTCTPRHRIIVETQNLCDIYDVGFFVTLDKALFQKYNNICHISTRKRIRIRSASSTQFEYIHRNAWKRRV